MPVAVPPTPLDIAAVGRTPTAEEVVRALDTTATTPAAGVRKELGETIAAAVAAGQVNPEAVDPSTIPVDAPKPADKSRSRKAKSKSAAERPAE